LAERIAVTFAPGAMFLAKSASWVVVATTVGPSDPPAREPPQAVAAIGSRTRKRAVRRSITRKLTETHSHFLPAGKIAFIDPGRSDRGHAVFRTSDGRSSSPHPPPGAPPRRGRCRARNAARPRTRLRRRARARRVRARAWRHARPRE